MPSHQDRREPLPKGYQFGDAKGGMYIERAAVTLARSMNVLTRGWITKAEADAHPHWNVIEGDQH